jgi:8-oxo-dGTP pyrophosphatase MutT (NUDIX family)
MECVNCGKRGHSFRDCKEPTASYGVIATQHRDEPYYLLIRRRDSLGYVDFLRGKYSLTDRPYIEVLLNQMTTEERKRLLTVPFDTLWVNLWNGQNTRQFRNEHESAKRTFETLKATGDVEGRQLAKYIAETKEAWEEPEWGFPKGRKCQHESDKSCALREFCEETGLQQKDISLVEMTPETEEYTGTNGIRYKHTYFIGKCTADVRINPGNHVQMREVGGIGWFPFHEAYLRIRDTNPEKRAVLGRLHARLTEES